MSNLNLQLPPDQDDSEYAEKCELIIEWAQDRPSFDDSFVVDLASKIHDGETLTDGQRNAIDNIIERFGIE